ncbi:MAG: hypothetical protein WC806_03590 [Candidatus Gracilibacteria bacterium]|jgi:mRNA-degrading endonuclease RelE of RelBE toxin-antitoxin system
MIKFIFLKNAQKQFLNLGEPDRNRILNKLKFLKNHTNIFFILKPLHGFEFVSYRLRIGNYRLCLGIKLRTKDDVVFFVFKVGHRREIYS